MCKSLIFERIEFLSIMSDAELKVIPCGFLNVSFLSSSESRAIETNLKVSVHLQEYLHPYRLDILSDFLDINHPEGSGIFVLFVTFLAFFDGFDKGIVGFNAEKLG